MPSTVQNHNETQSKIQNKCTCRPERISWNYQLILDDTQKDMPPATTTTGPRRNKKVVGRGPCDLYFTPELKIIPKKKYYVV